MVKHHEPSSSSAQPEARVTAPTADRDPHPRNRESSESPPSSSSVATTTRTSPSLSGSPSWSLPSSSVLTVIPSGSVGTGCVVAAAVSHTRNHHLHLNNNSHSHSNHNNNVMSRLPANLNHGLSPNPQPPGQPLVTPPPSAGNTLTSSPSPLLPGSSPSTQPPLTPSASPGSTLTKVDGAGHSHSPSHTSSATASHIISSSVSGMKKIRKMFGKTHSNSKHSSEDEGGGKEGTSTTPSNLVDNDLGSNSPVLNATNTMSSKGSVVSPSSNQHHHNHHHHKGHHTHPSTGNNSYASATGPNGTNTTLPHAQHPPSGNPSPHGAYQASTSSHHHSTATPEPVVSPADLDPIFEELKTRKEQSTRNQEDIESLKSQLQQECSLLSQTLTEERYRFERIEEQMNDLIELHQNEIENLKQGIADMEEKIQYQSEERLRDVYEMLESCQTRISRMEHQQHQHLQQLVNLDSLENSNARALVLKLINVLLTVLQVVLLLVATVASILTPFLHTRIRILTTIIFLVIITMIIRNRNEVAHYLRDNFSDRFPFIEVLLTILTSQDEPQ